MMAFCYLLHIGDEGDRISVPTMSVVGDPSIGQTVRFFCQSADIDVTLSLLRSNEVLSTTTTPGDSIQLE